MPNETYIVVDRTTKLVVNMVAWDGVSPHPGFENADVIRYDGAAGIGWEWDGTQVIDPRPPAENPFPPA